MFLNCYGIIKFINEKKLRKFNKLNIIFNNEILQIKDGNMQIKKIELILENLKKAKEINILMQNKTINKITKSQQKMSKIESLLEKINSLIKN